MQSRLREMQNLKLQGEVINTGKIKMGKMAKRCGLNFDISIEQHKS